MVRMHLHGFFESLFDFNGDGKVDWLDTADELAAMQLIKEAENKEPRRTLDTYDFDVTDDED